MPATSFTVITGSHISKWNFATKCHQTKAIDTCTHILSNNSSLLTCSSWYIHLCITLVYSLQLPLFDFFSQNYFNKLDLPFLPWISPWGDFLQLTEAAEYRRTLHADYTNFTSESPTDKSSTQCHEYYWFRGYLYTPETAKVLVLVSDAGPNNTAVIATGIRQGIKHRPPWPLWNSLMSWLKHLIGFLTERFYWWVGTQIYLTSSMSTHPSVIDPF